MCSAGQPISGVWISIFEPSGTGNNHRKAGNRIMKRKQTQLAMH